MGICSGALKKVIVLAIKYKRLGQDPFLSNPFNACSGGPLAET